jgi:proline iminopeptidase
MKSNFLLFATAAFVAATLSACDILDPSTPGLLVPQTVDEDPTLPSISVNGTHLHSETLGNPNDPLLVVLHGGPGGDYRYLLKCRQFAADGYYVVFFDQRGSGLSRRHPKESYTSVQLFIDDLDAVIKYYRRRDDQKVVLLGQSWGAMLATAYINQHPGEISGVILSEPGGLTWQDARDYAKRCRDMTMVGESANDYLYVDQLVTGDDHIMLDYKAALQSAPSFAPGNKVGNQGPFPFWRIGAVCNSAAYAIAQEHPFDFTTNLGQYSTKVLFCYSELDVAYGKTYAEHVSSAYSNVQLVEIKGSGHEIMYFGWDNFYPIAKAYLNTIK